MVTFVCSKCVCDPVLAEVVTRNLSSSTCTYCGRSEKDKEIASELDPVVECIRRAIDTLYSDDLAGELGWDGEDKCFVGHTSDTNDILQDDFDWRPENWDLFEHVLRYFEPEYAKRDYWAGTDTEQAMWAWGSFSRMVRHERRYTFWDAEPESDYPYYSPTSILHRLASTFDSTGMIRDLPVGSLFWRARTHTKSEVLDTEKEFTSPDDSIASANRMSPAGIAMFYGADDFETACKEVVGWHPDSQLTDVTAMVCETLVDLKIVDLTKLRKPRSEFEDWEPHHFEDYYFLRAFVREVSKPIRSDEDKHRLEYVPTQVFTEYLRYKVGTKDQPIHGIRYPSCHDRKPCIALFASKEQCLPGDERVIRPNELLRRSVKVRQVKKWSSKAHI